MQVDSKEAKKALAVFRETLLNLGIEDFVLSTLTEDQDGKVQYQTVFGGDEVTIAHILMNLEEETPDEVQDHIAKQSKHTTTQTVAIVQMMNNYTRSQNGTVQTCYTIQKMTLLTMYVVSLQLCYLRLIKHRWKMMTKKRLK